MNDAENWCDKALNYQFSDSDLLTRALTHRSASPENYERLEFLGDAVLDLAISGALHDGKPAVQEYGLTRYRAELVRKESLVDLAGTVGLAPHIVLGDGEQRSGVRHRDSVLADALEALFGAIFLDGGFDAVNRVILDLFRERLATLPEEDELKDAKSRLQELLQARQLPPPDYNLRGVTGPDHAPTFEVVCCVADSGIETTATDSSRRGAEQAAALLALDRFAGD